MSSTRYEVRGAVAVITLANPPVNGISYALRCGVVAGVDQASADPAIKAIVLIGSDRAFSGGADIGEFGSPKAYAEPNLPTLIRILETSAKPVIAAISGVCMGGGFELTLGCHFRLARPDAKIALPEVKLGLIPGAGGTQRGPRILGVETALNLMVKGDPVPASSFKDSPLIDEYVAAETDLLDAALAFAERVVAEKRPLRRVSEMKADYPDHEAFLQFARNMIKGVAGPFPAPLKCVDAVTAALTLPFEQGIKLERDLFVGLMGTPECRALRHAFSAERAASKMPDVPADTPTRTIASVGVIGAGTMGGGISMNFLNAGIPVTMLEMQQEALDRGMATIRKNYENSMKKGKLSQEKLDQRMGLLKGTLSYDDFKDADLIIEAVFEEIGVKEAVFKQLDKIAKPGAILASNTSTLDVNAIAEFTQRPQDVVGMHFFSPANVMRLLEVVRGAKTAKDVMATVMQVAKKIRKTAVVSGVCDGFIGNRMIEHYGRVAGFLLEEGATPAQVDRALEKWGMAMGPFRMGDLAGNDIGWAIRKRRYVEKPHIRYARFADRLCEQGRFGQKTGKGWYLYQPGNRKAIPDPEVDVQLVAYRKELGITPRKISDSEIVQRCVYALVNEGARILEEGIAARASDIDMIYLTGYGFPLFRGGPMLFADEVGLYNVARSMQAFAASSGDSFWEPAPLIAQRVAEGKSLT
ncbi:MAG: enoyl-CoA hydratase/isomerase family protein [Burkholderiaceae bacterium]|nr:enoyl-CoA hydratase/isomerase family protein [Sulfuritalea sp.]MCF8173889.1 enoyl-CoA hydratase/isomerase family protein [Burkholderiaceae bacterium]